jgi:hypothetical protein
MALLVIRQLSSPTLWDGAVLQKGGSQVFPLSLLSLSLTSLSVGVASSPLRSLCRASKTEDFIF